MKSFRFHRLAREEYLKSIRYFQSVSPSTARRVQAEFRRALNLIRRFPEAGRIIGEHGVRRILFRTLDHAIRYIYEDDEIFIVAVPDLRREPDYWLGRLDL